MDGQLYILIYLWFCMCEWCYRLIVPIACAVLPNPAHSERKDNKEGVGKRTKNVAINYSRLLGFIKRSGGSG